MRQLLPATAKRALLAVALAAACGVTAVAADAVTLRWAGRGDMQTTDPHSQNEGLTNNINSLVYEFLVDRDKELGLAPGARRVVDAGQSRRRGASSCAPGVKFHDGTPFTADDVVFSYERAKADTSQLRAYANAAGVAKKIDDLTVEFTTNGPNPIMLEHLATINIMSKAWCEKNKCMKPQNFAGKEEMITAREANGTGPYMLVSRQPDVKTVLKKNPELVGHQDRALRRQHRRRRVHADRVRRHARGRAHLGRGRPRQRPAAAGRAAPPADPQHQGDRGCREPHRVHRHGPGARRAPLFQRQGQESVQGRSRAPGALPGDRHRRDPEGDDARPVQAHRRDPALAQDVDARAREAPPVRQGEGEEAARRRRLPERLRGHARLPEQPLRERRAHLPGAWPPCGRRSAWRPR